MGLWVRGWRLSSFVLCSADTPVCREYEGLLTKQIREKRKAHGLDQQQEWDIWRDGCEGGEYVISS